MHNFNKTSKPNWQLIQTIPAGHSIVNIKFYADNNLIIVFSNKEGRVLNVIFENSILFFRSTDESFWLNPYISTQGNFGEFLFLEEGFIKSTESLLLDQFKDAANSFAKNMGIIHFIFADKQMILEIIATKDPIINES